MKIKETFTDWQWILQSLALNNKEAGSNVLRVSKMFPSVGGGKKH
jgi:hypothetical protein